MGHQLCCVDTLVVFDYRYTLGFTLGLSISVTYKTKQAHMMTIEVATCVFVDIFSFMLDFEID